MRRHLDLGNPCLEKRLADAAALGAVNGHARGLLDDPERDIPQRGRVRVVVREGGSTLARPGCTGSPPSGPVQNFPGVAASEGILDVPHFVGCQMG